MDLRLTGATPGGGFAAPVLPDASTGLAITLQLAKARKFKACAELFRDDATAYPGAIRSMLSPCPVAIECPTRPSAMLASGTEALAWLDEHPTRDALAEEHLRLFGGKDWAGAMPLVPACACSYLSEEIDDDIADVLVTYDAARFTPRTDGGRCPAHISNELEFVAHCLEAAATGDRDALLTCRAFVLSHLFGWGVVFAAATFARAATPPSRFAGAILEQLLFCERGHAHALAAGHS